MHEYEFRLVVQHSASFLPLLQTLGYPIQTQVVYYLKPHFRFRNGKFETKRVKSTHAVYHDRLWFRWVHSVETAFRSWSSSTHTKFLHNLGNYQEPLTVETRSRIEIDAHAQLYTFQVAVDVFRLVFEWEYGTFSKRKTRFDPVLLLGALKQYARFYRLLENYASPPYQLREGPTRRPVTSVDLVPEGEKYLYALKLDGVFGLVCSYRDAIKEKWEGYECVVRKHATLGDGLVFAAERLEGGEVCLLDVYQVRGHDTVKWCRREILTDFLPSLSLVEGYSVQRYAPTLQGLDAKSSLKTDGFIIHDVVRDAIFKFKTTHTIDLVQDGGYFYLPTGRIQCLEQGLEDGCVYEISTKDGRVVRKRTDRFKGNTPAQLENVLRHGWHGPPIEPLPPKRKKGKRLCC